MITETDEGVIYTPEPVAVVPEIEPVDCGLLAKMPSKEIAEVYVGTLLSEGILRVTPAHVQIMDLIIPRDRVVYFFIALAQLRTGEKYAHSERGFTVVPVTVVHGNDAEQGYRITSNADDKGSVLLTRRLAAEVYEVVAFFVREPDPATFVPKAQRTLLKSTVDTYHSEEEE